MSAAPIECREAQRQAWCRGCDTPIKRGDLMVTTYSRRNRGQYIHFCMDCASVISRLHAGAVAAARAAG